MANPLLRMTRQGSKTPVDRPQPVVPVVEDYVGDNNPYRGTEAHGVVSTNKPHNPDVYGVDPDHPDGQMVGLTEPERIPDPVPVRLVQEFKKELREFGTDRISLDFTSASNLAGRAVELIGRDEARSSIRLLNIDANNIVLVGSTREEVAMRGFPLYPGKDMTLTTENPVFATVVSSTYGVPTTVTVVAYVAEYRVKEA